MQKSKVISFIAWVVSPLFHTGLWFLWQTTAEAVAPLSDAYIRRPEWYAFIIVCAWVTLFARFVYVKLWR